MRKNTDENRHQKAFHPRAMGVMHSGRIVNRIRGGKSVRFRFDLEPNRVWTIPFNHTEEGMEAESENRRKKFRESLGTAD